MTWEENNEKGHSDRKNGINNKDSTAVRQYTIDMEYLNEFFSIQEASRCTKINRGNISSCCSGKLNSAGGFKWNYTEANQKYK